MLETENRIISLSTELTSLTSVQSNESVSEYVISAETGAIAKKNASVTLGGSLLITTVLRWKKIPQFQSIHYYNTKRKR